MNLSPALNVDSQTDIDVKGPMLEDLLELVNVKEEHALQAKVHSQEQLEQSQRRRKRISSLAGTWFSLDTLMNRM